MINLILKEIACAVWIWVQPAQDTVHWRAVMNTVLNLWAVNFVTS
jgi:hypothetical protein